MRGHKQLTTHVRTHERTAEDNRTRKETASSNNDDPLPNGVSRRSIGDPLQASGAVQSADVVVQDCSGLQERRTAVRVGQVNWENREQLTTLCTRRRLCTSSSPVQRRKAVSELCCSGLLKLKMRIPAERELTRGQQACCCEEVFRETHANRRNERLPPTPGRQTQVGLRSDGLAHRTKVERWQTERCSLGPAFELCDASC